MEFNSSFAGKTVSVFGAAKKEKGIPTWGSKLADRIEPLAERVLRVDPKLGVDGYDPRTAIREANTILFAVTPDEQINAIVADNRGEFHEGQVGIECSTTKRRITDTLFELDRRGLSICSIHPGARADLPSRGQNMLIMSVGEHGEAACVQSREITTLLDMNPIDFVRFDQHSRAMAIVQAVDHAIQRAKIMTLCEVLPKLGFTFRQVEAMAFACARVNGWGLERVAIQNPAVSAKVIRETLEDPEARIVLDTLQRSLEIITQTDAPTLIAQFQRDIDALTDEAQRDQMLRRTNHLLEQDANLRRKGMRVHSNKDEIGTLDDILNVFRDHGINLTAITTHVLEPEEGRPGVTFHLGIDEKITFDIGKLTADLKAIGVEVEA